MSLSKFKQGSLRQQDALDAIAEIFVLSDNAVQIQVERISLGNTPGKTSSLFYGNVRSQGLI